VSSTTCTSEERARQMSCWRELTLKCLGSSCMAWQKLQVYNHEKRVVEDDPVWGFCKALK